VKLSGSAKAAPCNYSLTSSSQQCDASGGTWNVNVNAPNGCSWTAASNASWITITSGASGSGNGTVYYSVSANSSTNSRSGTMTIAGQSFTITQQATTIQIHSLSAMSALPASLLTISGSGFDPASQLSVRFSDEKGFTAEVPLTDADVSSATVPVPPFINQATGNFGAGLVNVQLVQRTGSTVFASNTLSGFEIKDLPVSTLPAGSIILGYLKGALNEAIQQQQAIKGTPLDTIRLNAALADQIMSLNTLIGQIEAVVNGSIESFALGTIDGNSIVIRSGDLLNADRLVFAVLIEQASFESLSARNSPLQAFPPAMLAEGLAVPQAQEAQNLANAIQSGDNPVDQLWGVYFGAPRRAEAENPEEAFGVSGCVLSLSIGMMSTALYAGVTIPGAQVPSVGVFLIGSGLYYIGLAIGEHEHPDFLGQVLDNVEKQYNRGSDVLNQFITRSSGTVQGSVRNSQDLFKATVSLKAGTLKDAWLGVGWEGDCHETINSSPPGINCGTDCHEIYDIGKKVTLTVSDNDPNCTFKGWTAGPGNYPKCSGVGSCSLVMNKDVAVSAKFSRPQKPNLTPHKPQGWSDKIVVSKVAGCTASSCTDSSPLLSTDTLYVALAVINNGSAATSSPFITRLYVDGIARLSVHADQPLEPGYYMSDVNYSIGSLSAGTHTIKIEADSTHVIDETDESDNEYTKTITVQTQMNGTMTWVFKDSCNDGSQLKFKFYDFAENLVWPSSSQYYYMNYNNTVQQTLNCPTGDQICYGAESASGYWGVGLYGDQGCSGCCYTCDGGTYRITFTCGQPPPSCPCPVLYCPIDNKCYTVAGSSPCGIPGEIVCGW
jgi:hypothetical protein